MNVDGIRIGENKNLSAIARGLQDSEHRIAFTIPIFEPLATQYFVKLVALDWLYAETQVELDLQDIVLPIQAGTHTDLLDLAPLPRNALQNNAYEKLYEQRFSHFNPIQTQAFHVLYHTDKSVLLGAPTGALTVLCACFASVILLMRSCCSAHSAHPSRLSVDHLACTF